MVLRRGDGPWIHGTLHGKYAGLGAVLHRLQHLHVHHAMMLAVSAAAGGEIGVAA